ncbi:MAG: glucosaminidase domain-containing protein, partial [Phaeodactylibacter sp.]|nr:glucosaminidase domain-containing protein [Phaeodactylibacter sp.]
MNYFKLLPFFLLLLGQQLFAASESDRLDYIDKFKRIAVLEMERTGIPASIKLAQGILESDGGNSYLAREANNHFGIKCGPGWKGEKLYKK